MSQDPVIDHVVNSQTMLEQYKTLFDTLERQPLTLKQRQACVSPAQNTLVLAGAGTGKTSTLMGRVAYLIQSQQARADEILMLAFAVEAADEMQERGEFLLDSRLTVISRGQVEQGGVTQAQVGQGGETQAQVEQGGVTQAQVGQGGVRQAKGASVNVPNKSQGFTARTFHSLGLHILQSVQNQEHERKTLSSEQSLNPSKDIKLKLTQLNEEGRLQAFMQSSFQDLLQQEDGLYAQALQDYYTFYNDEIAQGIWRSLADEYVRNPLELMLANTLYLSNIAYQYQAHFADDIYLSPYKPYRATFFLPACNLYINVFNCVEADLDKPQEKSALAHRQRREQVRRIHHKRGITALEIYQDKILDGISGELLTKVFINSLQCQNVDSEQSQDVDYEQCQDVDSAQCQDVDYEQNSITGQSDAQDLPSYTAALFVQDSPSYSIELQYLQAMQVLFIEQLKACPRQAMSNPIMRSQGRADQLLQLLTNLMQTLHAEGIDGQVLKQSLSCELQCLVDLLNPLYSCYLEALKDESAIDFEQMIQYATAAVRSGAYKVSWRDILIDEFQDISPSRFALIQAIREQKPDIRIFCVGDDWQSIYQFAGSQVRYTRDFEQYFGASQRYTLDMTFRFHQALCDISTRFIQANPLQTRKDLKSFQAESKMGLSLLSDEMSMDRVLEQIASIQVASLDHNKLPKPLSCLVLARFSHLLPSTQELSRWHTRFPHLRIKLSTIHAAKGKEADYVIVLGNQAGQFGLPSDKQSHPLIQIIRQDEEDYLHAQERRVFYVAITRARQHVYLLYSVKKPSAFIQELEAGAYAYWSDLRVSRKKRFHPLGSAQKLSSVNATQLWQRGLKCVFEWVRGN